MDRLAQDLRFALRTLAATPALTLAAVLTLAIGVGAATAIGTAANLALVRPLPYPHGERLVHVGQLDDDGSSVGNVGFATALDWRARVASFDELALVRGWTPTLVERGGAERLDGMKVSWTFFRMLGIAPAMGRGFERADDDPERWRVVLLSDRLWRTRFGGRHDIVGSTIELNGRSYEVAGVMPASFEPLVSEHFYARAEIWAPLGYAIGGDSACRSCQHLKAIARLRPGATLAAAEQEVGTVQAQLRRDHPADYSSQPVLVRSLHAQIGSALRRPLHVLLAAALFVLVVACANVAGLLLARGADRQREMAVRAALGAATSRLVAQLLTEALVMAFAAAIAGLLVARWGLLLLARYGPIQVPRLEQAAADPFLPLAAAALSAVALFGFALLPAWTSARTNPQSVLREGRTTAGRGALRARELVMTGQVAIAMVLVAGAALMSRTVDRLLHVDPGFDPRGVLSLGLSLVGPGWAEDSAVRTFQEDLLRRVRRLPGVEHAALAGQIPLGNNYDRWGFRPEGRQYAVGADVPSVERYSVTPDYFRVMRVPLRQGRVFADSDATDAPRVMLVGETTARTLWPGESPIGKRVRLESPNPASWTVVGVVGDVRHYELGRPPTQQFYLPQRQVTDSYLVLVVRTSSSPLALVQPIRQQVGALAPDVPIYDVATLDDRVSRSVSSRTFLMLLLVLLSAIAVALAAVGLYGVTAQNVAGRRRELGIRFALGATTRDVVGLVLARGMKQVLSGIVLGLAAAIWLGDFLVSQLYEIAPTDPIALAAAAGALVGVTLIAHLVPLRRAATIDPCTTLRGD
jgi:putative ABC transport system permease protein